MRDAFLVTLLSLLPRNHASRFMGWFARLRLPGFLNRWLLRWYVGHYRVDTREMEGSLADYPSLEAFFVRRLLPGARPVCEEPEAVVSPADSVLVAAGRVYQDLLPQSGKLLFRASELLGGDHPFEGGSFLILYLSPPDYHRVHAPLAGRVGRWQYLPGTLYPVFRAAADRVPGLFARNERLVTWLQTAAGQVAVVMVGAFGVGRMTASFCDLTTNCAGQARDERAPAPCDLTVGQELGCFHLGSTVILFFEPGRVAVEAPVGARVRVNARIGRVVAPS